MDNNLTFDKILAICSKETISGIYCYETKNGIEITDISQLNKINSPISIEKIMLIWIQKSKA